MTKMLRRIALAALAALAALLPSLAVAQFSDAGNTRVTLVSDYDLDSASYIYCTTAGPNGVLDVPGYVGASKVSTSGSSTTVARMTSTDPSPFTPVAVGDELLIVYNGTVYHRYVAARADANSITVNAAIDITNGAGFYYRKLTCGTAATSGWVPMEAFTAAQFDISIDQMDATSIDIKVECKQTASAGQPTLIKTQNATVATQSATNPLQVPITALYDYCRAGLKINTDDGVDTTTHAEQINIQFSGRRN